MPGRTPWALAMVVLLLVPAPGRGQADDPAEIMRRVQREATAPDERVDFRMQLIDDAGRTRDRTGTVHERQVAPGSLSEMRLIRFHSPPDLRGSGVLTIEHDARDNDQWLYLPAYHTTRRIPPANRSDRYMGTDFLYEDIMNPKIEEYSHRQQGEEVVDGVRCLVIVAVPLADQLRRETAYSKTVHWVDSVRDVILRTDYYDRSDTAFKRLTVKEVVTVSGKHRWREVRMEDFVRRHVTTIRYDGWRIGIGVPDYYFTERYLKRGQ